MNKILQGDCLTVLKTLDSESVDCVMTSPPYWALRDYGTATWVGGNPDCDHIDKGQIGGQGEASKKQHTSQGTQQIQYRDTCGKCGAERKDLQLGLEPTFQEYIHKLCTIFDEVKRVLKKSGTCWVNLGDTYGGTGTGQEKSMDSKSKQTDGQYELATEARNIKNKGTKGIYDKCLLQIPSRFSIEMCNRGWILRNTLIWYKPNCMPSSVRDRFTVDFEYVFFFVKSKKYWFERQFEASVDPESYEGMHKRNPKKGFSVDPESYEGMHKRNPKKGFRDFEKGKGFEIRGGFHKLTGKTYPERNKRCVWKITTKPFKEAHFAVFPEELVETPIKAGCPQFVCNKCGEPREKILEPTEEYAKFLGKGWHDHKADESMGMGQQTRGFSDRKGKVDGIERYNLKGYTSCSCNAGFSGGIVLDPFSGSGTVAVVAKKLNRQYIGIELNPEYIKMAEKRINNIQESMF